MSLRGVFSIFFLFSFHSYSINGIDRQIRIDLTTSFNSASVWEYDLVTISKPDGNDKWFFDEILLAEFDGDIEMWKNKSTALKFNVIDEGTDNLLNLISLNRSYSGTYAAEISGTRLVLNLTVHGKGNHFLEFILKSSLLI